MLLFTYSFPFPLFFVNCFDFLCLQIPGFIYFVSPKYFGITFRGEFTCLQFHKADGGGEVYAAQWIDLRVSQGTKLGVSCMTQHVGLEGPPLRFLRDRKANLCPSKLNFSTHQGPLVKE